MKSILLFLSILFGLLGCSTQTQLRVLQPAEISTPNIQTVAIGNFEIESVQQVFQSERRGSWQFESVKLSKSQKAALSRAIRAQVVNLLTGTPSYQVIYTDEFAKLENDAQLQELISVQGYQSTNVDAVISGKVWLSLKRTDATELAKISLKYIQGGSKGLDVDVERLAWWPYKSARGHLSMEIKMTQLNPTQVIAQDFATRTYAQKIDGVPSNAILLFGSDDPEPNPAFGQSPDVMPSFDQMIADLAKSIAASFVQKVAPTQKQVSYPVGTNGNQDAQLLIQAGAYDLAIERLQTVTSQANQASSDDFYNLGLAFEAIGDYGLAQNFYQEAFNADPENLMYAQGLGRIEQQR